MTEERALGALGSRDRASRDPVSLIRSYNADREPERRRLKWRAMRASPFAFFRGSAHLFWSDLASHTAILPASPLAWCCGDLHLENFGSYRGDNGLAYFDLNDFDEAARAPLLWDLTRFVTSLFVAAPVLGLGRRDAEPLAKLFLATYRAALIDGKARWIERATARGPVRDLLRGVKRRSRAELLDKRTVRVDGSRRLRIDNRHALSVTAAQRATVTDWCRRFAESEPNPKFFRVLDVARRVAGTGSLGVERFIILVRGDGTASGNVILDAKAGCPSSLAAALGLPQPAWHSEAQRVVTTQHRMQAISPAFLRALRLERASVVLRELQPVEDRLVMTPDDIRRRRLHAVVRDMAHIVAWAHLRASGRAESANADALDAFARSGGWRRGLLEYARRYARQVDEDFRRFVVAHEEGALD